MAAPDTNSNSQMTSKGEADGIDRRRKVPFTWDSSYLVGRSRQYLDLWTGALLQMSDDRPVVADDADDDEFAEAFRQHQFLELYVKTVPRGPGYVADFVYRWGVLPFAVYGTLVNLGHGLVVNELELWRGGIRHDWDYRDYESGEFTGPDGREWEIDGSYGGVTPADLRRIPIGWILDEAQIRLSDRSWETEGIFSGPGRRVESSDLEKLDRSALERASGGAIPRRRGRPLLSDDLLRDVALAYLDEVDQGPGLTARLAVRFDRPEPTISDWIASARRREFLSSAKPGKRGATAGPRLECVSVTEPNGAADVDEEVDPDADSKDARDEDAAVSTGPAEFEHASTLQVHTASMLIIDPCHLPGLETMIADLLAKKQAVLIDTQADGHFPVVVGEDGIIEIWPSIGDPYVFGAKEASETYGIWAAAWQMPEGSEGD